MENEVKTEAVVASTKRDNSMFPRVASPPQVEGYTVENYKKERIEDSIEDGDLLLIRKFVRRMKGTKRKIISGKVFEKAANLGPYQVSEITS